MKLHFFVFVWSCWCFMIFPSGHCYMDWSGAGQLSTSPCRASATTSAQHKRAAVDPTMWLCLGYPTPWPLCCFWWVIRLGDAWSRFVCIRTGRSSEAWTKINILMDEWTNVSTFYQAPSKLPACKPHNSLCFWSFINLGLLDASPVDRTKYPVDKAVAGRS